MPSPEKIAGAAQLACLLEASSYPKPGNVSPFRGYAELSYPDFLAGAVAIRPSLDEAARAGARGGRVPLGRLMADAAKNTLAFGGRGNVNSGIILMLVPLAAAFARAGGKKGLAQANKRILAQTNADDAVFFYRMLKTLGPWLPKVKRLDVYDAGSEKKIRGMKANLPKVLALGRDEVAREVLHGYPISRKAEGVFRQALGNCRDIRKAAAQTFLWILAHHLDGMMEKKIGWKKAEWVSRKAGEVLKLGGVLTPAGYMAAKRLDDKLFELGPDFNPGSTADLVCGAIFLALAEKL